RPAVLDLLPLDVQPHRGERAREVLRDPLLLAGRAGDVDQVARRLDQAAPIDLDGGAGPYLHAGRTFSENSRSCPSRSSPHSSSITCVQPASRYSRIAATQSSGVPAIGLHLSRISSVTAAFAASRPPCSIASATGRISSCVNPAHSSSVSAAAWMFCTLFARYMPAISRAPSRPRSRSSSIEATIVQPRSSESGSRPASASCPRT